MNISNQFYLRFLKCNQIIAIMCVLMALVFQAVGDEGNIHTEKEIVKVEERGEAESFRRLSQILDRASVQQQPSEELFDWLQVQDMTNITKAIELFNSGKVFPRERKAILERSIDIDPIITLTISPEPLAFKAWVRKSSPAALDWLSRELEKHPTRFRGNEKTQLLRYAANSIAKKDPLLAIGLIGSFGAIGQEAISKECINPVISRGFTYSITWIRKCPFKSVNSELFYKLGERFPVLSSECVSSNDEFSSYIYEVAGGRLNSDPEGAIIWLDELPAEKSRTPINRLCEIDPVPESLVSWLLTKKGEDWLDQARMDCALKQVEDNPRRALDLVLQIKGISRWWGYQQVIKRWKNMAKATADSWLMENLARIPIPTDSERSYQYIDGT